MALKEQVIPIPLGGSRDEGGGINEGVDDKLLSPPYLLELHNGNLGKDGSVRRRRPANELSDEGISDRAKQNLNSLFNHNGTSLVVSTAMGPHTYTEGTGWATPGELGQVPCSVSDDVAVECHNGFVDSAISNGIIAYVQLEDDAVYLTAYEYETGALVCPKARVSTVGTWFNPKIIADATTGYFNVLYMSAGVSGDLVMSKVDAANFPAVSLSTSVTVDTSVDQYDVALGGSSTIYVATGRSSHQTRVASYTVPVSGSYTNTGSQIVSTIGSSNGLGLWFNATSARVYLVGFDPSVDASNALTAWFTSTLSSQSIGDSIELAPVPYNTGPSSGWIAYTGFVGTFAYSGVGTGEMLLTISTICYKQGISVRPEYARGQYGCTQMVLMSTSLANVGDIKTVWNYYAVTKAWNPDGSPSARPVVGLMRLQTRALVTPGPVDGTFAYWLQQYTQSIQGTILLCSYGALPVTDSEGDTRAQAVFARCHDDVAATPDAWRFDPDFDTTSVPVPWYFSRLSWVSALPSGSRVFARATYDQYLREVIEQTGSPTAKYQYYGTIGKYGHVRTTEFTVNCPPVSSSSIHGVTVVAGGYAGVFDGTGGYESAWHTSPEVFRLYDSDPNSIYSLTANPFTATNPAILPADPAATNLVFVWVWTDDAGLMHRSAPSEPWPARAFQMPDEDAVAGQYVVTVDMSDLPMSAVAVLGPPRYIEIYTTAGIVFPNLSAPTTGDAGVYFVARVPYDPAPSGTTPRDDTRPWQLSFDVPMVFLREDGSSPYDTSATVYTTGDVLEALPPPAPSHSVSTSDRAWLINDREVWPSKVLEPGVAPEFNGNLAIPMLTGQGPCVAIAALDEKVIVFKESSIFVITGDGPNNTGGGNAFGVPQAISTDIGCTSRASVVRGPFGLAFQSARGIYLLDRGLNLTWLGKPVEESLRGQTIVCGVVVPEEAHVRWIVGTGDDTFMAVWNYDMNQWGLFDGSKELHGVPWNGAWVGLLDALELPDTTTAYFAQEFEPVTDSSGNYVQYPLPLSFTTSWIKAGGIQGFVRCRRALLLGKVGTIPGFFNAHNGLQIEAQYNYDPTTLTTYAWDPDETHLTWPNFECHLQYQKFEVIRFVVSEVPIDGQLTCPGGAFSGMTLRVAVKGVPFKYLRQGDVR